ncbi:hypothetical protein MJD09_23215 [bacterium]|nr:hypothetical protein [bacterium]
MKDKSFIIEARTLEEAHEKAKAEIQVPKDCVVLSKKVLDNGEAKQVNAAADTVEAAFKKAQRKIPKKAGILERIVVAEPMTRTVDAQSFEGASESEQLSMALGCTVT